MVHGWPPSDRPAAVDTLRWDAPVGEWPASAALEADSPVAGRIRMLRRTARGQNRKGRPAILRLAGCVIVCTACPPDRFPAQAVPQWSRMRWQGEPVSKPCKALTRLRCLPQSAAAGAPARCTAGCWWRYSPGRSCAAPDTCPPGICNGHRIGGAVRAVISSSHSAPSLAPWHRIAASVAEPRRATSAPAPCPAPAACAPPSSFRQ